MGKLSDEEILDGLVAGGRKREEALDALYKQEWPAILLLVKNKGGDSNEADEIFQETIKAFLQDVLAEKFKRQCTIGTYLYRIAFNKWMTELKRKGRLKEFNEMLKENPDYEVENKVDPPSETEFSEECKRWVRAKMKELGDVCEKLLTLRFFDELSISIITEKMSYKEEQVTRTKLYKCRERLKQLLAQDPLDCL